MSLMSVSGTVKLHKAEVIEREGNVDADEEEMLDPEGEDTGEKNTSCSFCGKGFSTQQIAKKHGLVIHQGLKNYKCMHCGRTFGQHSTVKKTN